jgi:hypothetical protein
MPQPAAKKRTLQQSAKAQSSIQEEDGKGDTMPDQQQQPVETGKQASVHQEQPAKEETSVQEAEEAEEEGDSIHQPAKADEQESLQQQAAEAEGDAIHQKQPPSKAGKQTSMQLQQPVTSDEEASMQSKAAEAEGRTTKQQQSVEAEEQSLLQQPTKALEQDSMTEQVGVQQKLIQKPGVNCQAWNKGQGAEQVLMEQKHAMKQVLIQQQSSECQVMMQQQQLAKATRQALMKQAQHEGNQASMQRLYSRGVEIVVGPVLIEIAESGSIRISYP